MLLKNDKATIVRTLQERGVLSRYGTLVTANVVSRNLRLLRQSRRHGKD